MDLFYIQDGLGDLSLNTEEKKIIDNISSQVQVEKLGGNDDENKKKIIEPDDGSELHPGTSACFNVFYYCFFLPFKILRNDKGSYIISASSTRLIICATVHILTCINSILEIRGLFVGKVRENPQLFFIIGERLTSVIYLIGYLDMAWFKKAELLDLFISTCEWESNPKKTRKVGIGFFLKFFSALLIVQSALGYISKYSLYPELNEGLNLLIQRIRLELNFIPCLTDVDLPITIWVSILLACRMFKWILLDYIGPLSTIVAFICWKMAKKFKQSCLELEGKSNLKDADEQIFVHYATLKEYFNKVNEFFGTIYVAQFLALLTYFSNGIVELLDTEEWNERVRIGIYLVTSVQLFMIAAEAHYHVSYFKTWLLKRQLNSFRHIGNYLAVENENVGISGGRLFTITYGFLGTAGSVILTYTIINLQFNGVKNIQGPQAGSRDS